MEPQMLQSICVPLQSARHGLAMSHPMVVPPVSFQAQHGDTFDVPVKRSRRGRRSTIPPEEREQTRKLKKQNMERRRRATISDKMTALHNLAMNLIGEDPDKFQRFEKADLLNICYTVFEQLVAIVNEQPDIRQRVQQVSRQLRERINTIPSDAPSEDSDSNSGLLDSFPNNATEAGHSQTQIDRHVVAAGVTDTTQHCSRQTSPPVHRNPNSDCHLIPQPKHYATSCLPLKRRLLAEQSRLCGNQSLGDDADRTFRPKTWINPAVTSNSRSSNMISSSESLVWRPYLD